MILCLVGALCLGLALVVPLPVRAAEEEEGNWRGGRIYYHMTCTACHKDMTGEGISPMSKNIAEWKVYIAADAHDASGRSNPSLKYYVSKAYRTEVKDSNKAAAKFINLTDDELLADVRTFVIHGAKDSDTPVPLLPFYYGWQPPPWLRGALEYVAQH